jgi:2-polyprenyl-3-methyl-5-hydroxy-6-metoxy-1,4-benzoquinol methylase
MTELVQCPICKGQTFQDIADCVDHTVSHETFHVKRCTNCELAITTPRPELSELSKYYKSEEYISHSGKTSGGIGGIYKIARSYALTWKKRMITKFNKGNTALDFGCGTGDFLYTLQKQGLQVDGVEPSNLARAKAAELNNQPIYSDINEIENKTFDVITAWHVIEHVPDLHATLLKLKTLLAKNGTVFIAVPNYQSYDSSVYKKYWAGYDVPRHLWHFSKKSMTHLLQSHGFALQEVIPMKLDSYYISLLSEKYKNQNRLTLTSLVKAFSNGFISNLKARIQTNHSSLIYIAKKNED